MPDPAPVAYAAIVLLGGALAGVVYLGTRAGPSRPPGVARPPSAAASASPAPAPGTADTTRPSTEAAIPAPARRFVASADLTSEEQVALERLNRVRADPPAFVDAWRRILAEDQAGDPACTEPPTMLDPIMTYAPRQPLAANQQLTDAARKHARDQLERGYFEHVNPEGLASNERVLAAGYPLPIDVPLTLDGYYFSSKRGVGNLESLHMNVVTTSGPAHRFPPAAYADAIDGLVIDACVASRGHRLHLLGARGSGAVELEIGVGAVTGEGRATGQWTSADRHGPSRRRGAC